MNYEPEEEKDELEQESDRKDGFFSVISVEDYYDLLMEQQEQM